MAEMLSKNAKFGELVFKVQFSTEVRITRFNKDKWY